jgi:hypothetical protein
MWRNRRDAQSPYSAGLVSGRNAQSRAALAPVIAAIVRNPVKSPNRLAMNPTITVLTAAAMAVRGESADRSLRQVEAAGAGGEIGDHQNVNTVMIAPVMPSST